MREKQNPVEKEWAAVVKAEERFLRHAMPARTAGWQEKITRYVPQKLEATLHTAFYKAFELIFDKGTPVIEKTCQKEKKEQNYKINAYAAEVRDTRHALRAFGREAGASRNLNLAVSAVEGVGMGFFGLGLPDIPLFLGVLLKSIYEVALSYGYTYDTQEEQIFILKLIETALSHGEQLAQNNMELNLWMREERTFSISRNEQIRRTSDALAWSVWSVEFLIWFIRSASAIMQQLNIKDVFLRQRGRPGKKRDIRQDKFADGMQKGKPLFGFPFCDNILKNMNQVIHVIETDIPFQNQIFQISRQGIKPVADLGRYIRCHKITSLFHISEKV